MAEYVDVDCRIRKADDGSLHLWVVGDKLGFRYEFYLEQNIGESGWHIITEPLSHDLMDYGGFDRLEAMRDGLLRLLESLPEPPASGGDGAK